MGIASSKMSPSSLLSYQLGGVMGIQRLKQLDDSFAEAKHLARVAGQLEQIHQLVLNARRQFLVVAETELTEEVSQYVYESFGEIPVSNNSQFSLSPVRETVKEAWLTSTQVNFCAKAYPTVSINHEDAPALTVLGGFLKNGYLHRAVREQGGAYGGGAGQDSGSACFRFYSYRDPRLSETLDDFDASLSWLHENQHDAEQLEQAILGVVSQIDKPRSPAGEAKSDFHSALFGRNREDREKFRANILKVGLDDLLSVAKRYLKPEDASVGVVSQPSNKEKLQNLGLEIFEL